MEEVDDQKAPTGTAPASMTPLDWSLISISQSRSQSGAKQVATQPSIFYFGCSWTRGASIKPFRKANEPPETENAETMRTTENDVSKAILSGT